jgi:hypothetical protein
MANKNRLHGTVERQVKGEVVEDEDQPQQEEAEDEQVIFCLNASPRLQQNYN